MLHLGLHLQAAGCSSKFRQHMLDLESGGHRRVCNTREQTTRLVSHGESLRLGGDSFEKSRPGDGFIPTYSELLVCIATMNAVAMAGNRLVIWVRIDLTLNNINVTV